MKEGTLRFLERLVSFEKTGRVQQVSVARARSTKREHESDAEVTSKLR
jgi:hypothetical protein